MSLIKVYTLLQISMSILLISVLIHFDYSLIHSIIFGIIFSIMWLATKLKHTAIGMYLGATDAHLRNIIRQPFIIKNESDTNKKMEDILKQMNKGDMGGNA